MFDSWQEERSLVVVKTYPTPSTKSIETVCTAGIREGGGFIRLFPVPFRLLEPGQQFSKYNWIRVPVKKARDPRPESFNPYLDNLVVEGQVKPNNNWSERRRIVLPLLAQSIEDLWDRQKTDGTSLGIIKPHEILGFDLRADPQPDWTPAELAKLRQTTMFGNPPRWLLQKIPYEFHYRFRCDDSRCRGHDMQCFDWEIYEAYRSWEQRYPDPAVFKEKFLQRFRDEMIHKCDTHFFVGTLAKYPTTWTIIGLFYPRYEKT